MIGSIDSNMVESASSNLKVLAIIPARAGSKRIPDKNTRLFNGKPLIEYTIDNALECGYVTDIIITSNDPKVKKIADERNINYRQRPEYLCKDESLSQTFIDDIFETYGNEWDMSLLLQPTSPLRKVEHINRCIEMYVYGNFTSVISVIEVTPHVYYPNGSIYVFKDKIHTENMGMILFPKDESIDIDVEIDFKLAEMIMKGD